MCGFLGMISSELLSEEKFKQALDTINHRGPDQKKVDRVSEYLQFGFVRLAIIDLNGGAQPMHTPDGKISIVFNGEIYNYIELREQLKKRGHEFETQSDTEVLLHMYAEYGICMLDKIQGMYGITIFDREKDEVYLIRDRLGIKPLYYATDRVNIAFSSEIKPLLKMPFVRQQISKQSVGEFLMYQYIQAPNTIFESVKQVVPGHYLKIKSSGEIEEKKYWDCSKQKSIPMQEQEAKEKVIGQLKEAVRLHLRSDVPVAFLLSGGIDSGLLVAFASEYIDNVNTYTLKFSEKGFDESKLAELVAKKYHTNHKCFEVKEEELKKLLPEMIWYFDNPLGDSGILPNYLINKMVAQDGIKVVISGAGGDELFAGYKYYFAEDKEKILVKYPFISRVLATFIRPFNRRLSDRITTGLNWEKDAIGHMLLHKRSCDDEFINQILNYKWEDISRKEAFYESFCEEGLNACLYTDIKTYLAGDLLLLSDRTCMASSIEGRVPFLHHPFVEMALAIPSEIKAKDGTRKWLLRECAKEYLPSEILNAPKKGFESPIRSWGTGEFGEFAYRILNSKKATNRDIWNRKYYYDFVSDRNNYNKNFTKIYLLLVMEIFLRVHVDNSFESAKEIDYELLYSDVNFS